MKAREMTNLLENEFSHKSIYVWGGQGESLEDTTIGDLFGFEASSGDTNNNVIRILDRFKSLISEGYNYKRIRLFDCSGLIVWALTKLGIIVGDYTADNLYQMGENIPLKSVKEGDLVFKGTSKTKTHVGYVNEKGTVYECKGRDYGVVESSINSWSFACHYTWWETNNLDHKLKLKSGVVESSAMIKNVQRALCSKGCLCAINGTLTQNTVDAIKKFQTLYKLNPASAGVISKKTCLALGMTWKGKSK